MVLVMMVMVMMIMTMVMMIMVMRIIMVTMVMMMYADDYGGDLGEYADDVDVMVGLY